MFANLNSVYPNPNSAAIMSEIRTAPFNVVREINLCVIDRLIRFGLTEDDRKLGAFYVLSALTLVSPGARNALPWLYQSVVTVTAPPVYYYVYADPVSPPVIYNLQNAINEPNPINNINIINNLNNLNNV
jgi:hypothetical protein